MHDTVCPVTTVVAFHAHPDDEALWTGGTLALLAMAGHRVVVVVATDGHMGDAADPASRIRLDELTASATVLGAARSVCLGYADSGHGAELFPDPPGRRRFARADLDEAAGRLTDVLRDEQASVLLSYDARGGYGHRDHVRVHQVGAQAATLVGGIRVLEATLPRESVDRITRAGRLAARVRRTVMSAPPQPATPMFTPRGEIDYRVDVRRHAAEKRAALAAHRSQLAGSRAPARLRRYATHLPVPAFALLGGWEWFNDPVGPRAADFLDLFTDSR
jgi:LmbE family N-acetylglucosaminyl deacetylase